MTSCFSWLGYVVTACSSMESLDPLARPSVLQSEQMSTTESLFEDCREVARTLRSQCERVKFNKSLCSLLAAKYSDCLESVFTLSDTPVCKTVVAELRRVTLCGEMLVAQWTKENWWKSVISSSDSASIQEKVFLHLNEFLFCVKVLTLIASNGIVPDGTFLRPVVLDLSTRDVEEASQRDIESLFRAVQGDKRTSFPETKLAEYVLVKFRAGNSDDGHLHSIDYNDVELGAHIGKGSFGAVFECKFFGERAAAKVFTTPDSTWDTAVQKEAKLQASLRHPNVVQFIGYAVQGNQHIIVSELMSKDLRNYLNENVDQGQTRRPLSLLLAVDIMLQIAEAMKYLHQNGVMHRDLKANNVLINVLEMKESWISPSVQVKLTDFGFSKLNQDNSRFTSWQTGGTLWRAPEVFEDEQNKEKYTRKADIYSFAIVFFEVLTGEIPWYVGDEPTISLSELLEKIRHGERPTLPPDCPAHLVALINKCWATVAEDRPAFPEICQLLWQCKFQILTYAYPCICRWWLDWKYHCND